MRNIQITKYKNLTSPYDSENVNLLEWLKGEKYKDLVLHLRSLTNKDQRSKLKKTMPCVTISGTFLTRKRDSLVKHSGFICIDIDGQDNPEVENFSELRDELANIVNIAYSGLSVGGNGVYCLIPIKNTEKHKEHFEALQLCFEKLGITIDKQCSDVGRLRICSYDPEAYFNENAVVFDEFIEHKTNVQSKKKANLDLSVIPETFLQNKNYSKNDYTEKKVTKIIDEISLRGIDITGGYGNWFKICCALANHFGAEGREMFHLVSKYHPKYMPEKTDTQFDEILKSSAANPIGIGTFFLLAETYGL